MSMPLGPQAWTDQVRRQAVIAVRIAAAKRAASERTFLYFLRAALAHGVATTALAQAAGISETEVIRLTDPGAVA